MSEDFQAAWVLSEREPTEVIPNSKLERPPLSVDD
jgi:hypothetical protein